MYVVVNLTVSEVTLGAMLLTWHPPSDNGGSPVIHYAIEWLENIQWRPALGGQVIEVKWCIKVGCAGG